MCGCTLPNSNEENATLQKVCLITDITFVSKQKFRELTVYEKKLLYFCKWKRQSINVLNIKITVFILSTINILILLAFKNKFCKNFYKFTKQMFLHVSKLEKKTLY